MKATTRIKTLKINGKDISARAGQTILEVARESNIFIPTLCYLEGLSKIGACRMCIVEIKDSPKLVPACVTTVWEGMEVYTDTEKVKRFQKRTLELIFSERNHTCAVCVSNNHCELQSLAQKIGMDHVSYHYIFPKMSIDASHPRFMLDHNRCILCARCVRVCAEIEGAHTWDIADRGLNAHVIIDFNQSWAESETCTGCSKCVHVCPTGALSEKGKSVTEMIKGTPSLPYLRSTREEIV